MSEHGETGMERLGDVLIVVVCALALLALLAPGWL
jgi:hypothetical protein